MFLYEFQNYDIKILGVIIIWSSPCVCVCMCVCVCVCVCMCVCVCVCVSSICFISAAFLSAIPLGWDTLRPAVFLVHVAGRAWLGFSGSRSRPDDMGRYQECQVFVSRDEDRLSLGLRGPSHQALMCSGRTWFIAWHLKRHHLGERWRSPRYFGSRLACLGDGLGAWLPR